MDHRPQDPGVSPRRIEYCKNSILNSIFTTALEDGVIVVHPHGQMPAVHIALHAGELTLGLVEPARLRDHIRKAVEVGHA